VCTLAELAKLEGEDGGEKKEELDREIGRGQLRNGHPFCVCRYSCTMIRPALLATLMSVARAAEFKPPNWLAECKPPDWLGCRAALLTEWGVDTAPRKPDWVLPDGGHQVRRGGKDCNKSDCSGIPYTMNGFPSPGDGSHLGAVKWQNNLTALVWEMKSEYLTMNTTVLYSLNTSSRAPANYNPPPYANGKGPSQPGPHDPWGASVGYNPQGAGDTLIIYHSTLLLLLLPPPLLLLLLLVVLLQPPPAPPPLLLLTPPIDGHESASCTPNYDGVVDYFNEIGYDVMEMFMPLIGCNQAYQYGNPRRHAWFAQWEAKGDKTMKWFIEPVALAAAYAKALLGYKHIVMVGLSGGGWTTTLASAVVTDIELSFPTAGSTPKWPTKTFPQWVPDLPEGRNHRSVSPNIFVPPPQIGAGGDYEQNPGPSKMNATGIGYAELYVLAALEPNRKQLQIMHEYDSCCFRGAGLFDPIKAYNKIVNAAENAKGYMQTAVTSGNYHQVNQRDKILISIMIEKLRRKGNLTKEDFAFLPYDDLRIQ